MSKRITILLEDSLYRDLVDYTADKSKNTFEKMNLSKIIRDMLAARLEQLGYANPREAIKPMKQPQLETTNELPLRTS